MLMATIHQIDGLLFVPAELHFRGRSLELLMMIDTGSVRTVVSADAVSTIGIKAERTDSLHRVWGVGGSETVCTKSIDAISIFDFRLEGFQIEIGTMDYGFEIQGILGLDFLIPAGVAIDLATMEFRTSLSSNA